MKVTPEVTAALQTLKDAAENDFERHSISTLEKILTSPPLKNQKANPRLIDLTGKKFGRLLVISHAGISPNGDALWLCYCDCGNEIVANGKLLKNGNTRSCGCLRRFQTQKRGTHRMSNTPIYNVWSGIKDRCLNVKSKHYPNYGGRGITICDEWKNDFNAFHDYVSKLEHFGEEGYTLDRIDNDGNYEPDNLRWADSTTQSRNRRNVRRVSYKGEEITLPEAAEKSGIRINILYDRLRNGDTTEERIFRPIKPR